MMRWLPIDGPPCPVRDIAQRLAALQSPQRRWRIRYQWFRVEW